MNNIPYTYLIGWSSLNKWYYGVRYSKNCQPLDLWNPYKTSSKIVKNFIALHGEPDICTVRKIFTNINNARIWENRVLVKLDVINDTKWLNRHNNIAFDPTLVPKGNNHWTKKQPDKWKEIQARRKFIPNGDFHWTHQQCDAAEKHKIRMLGESNPNNFPHNKIMRSNMLKENNPVNIPGVKDKIREQLTGYKHPRKICEYCDKNIADSVYTRYHGPKCKNKPQ